MSTISTPAPLPTPSRCRLNPGPLACSGSFACPAATCVSDLRSGEVIEVAQALLQLEDFLGELGEPPLTSVGEALPDLVGEGDLQCAADGLP